MNDFQRMIRERVAAMLPDIYRERQSPEWHEQYHAAMVGTYYYRGNTYPAGVGSSLRLQARLDACAFALSLRSEADARDWIDDRCGARDNDCFKNIYGLDTLVRLLSGLPHDDAPGFTVGDSNDEWADYYDLKHIRSEIDRLRYR